MRGTHWWSNNQMTKPSQSLFVSPSVWNGCLREWFAYVRVANAQGQAAKTTFSGYLRAIFRINLSGVPRVPPTPPIGLSALHYHSLHTFFPSHKRQVFWTVLNHKLHFVQAKSSHPGVPAVALMQNWPSPKCGLLLRLHKHGKAGFHRRVRSCCPLGQQRIFSPELCLNLRDLDKKAATPRLSRTGLPNHCWQMIQNYIIHYNTKYWDLTAKACQGKGLYLLVYLLDDPSTSPLVYRCPICKQGTTTTIYCTVCEV